LTWFDVEEQKRSNSLIVGCNSSGKTYLLASIEQALRLEDDWKTICFDNAGTFSKISDIPEKYRVLPVSQKIPIRSNICYDTSLLLRSAQIRFMSEMMRYYWLSRAHNGASKWLAFLVEECELIWQRIRSKEHEAILRICSSGRNQKLRMVGVTTDLSLLDTHYIRLAGQRYFSKQLVEENAQRKLRRTIGKSWTEQTAKLEVGEFIYQKGTEIRAVQVPCYNKICETMLLRENRQS